MGRIRSNAARRRSPTGRPADSAGFFAADFAAAGLVAFDVAALFCAFRAVAVFLRYSTSRAAPIATTITVIQNIHGNSEMNGNSTSVRIWLVLRGLGSENHR